MATIKNINVVLKNVDDNASSPTHVNSPVVYRINIQAADNWVVTGSYRNNILCGIEIKRNSCTQIEG